MKTKILFIAIAAVVLLSFTFISASHAPSKKISGKQEPPKGNQGGFALQDTNQF